jgi:gliding motility-associated-like protein
VFPADGGGFTVCLVAVNDVGCPDTICTAINVPGDPHIFVPNTFTPNNDTRNDTFRPILNGFVGWNYRFIVFDRWGLPVFDTRDRATPWDGTRNGTDSPVDVYVWKVIVERDGDARDFVGHVSLIR